MGARELKDRIERDGPAAALLDIACRAANKIADVLILKGLDLTMDTVDPRLLAESGRLRWGFLDEATLLRALGMGAGEDMDEPFVRGALARGDRCYGAVDGDLVASYGWYSIRPTPVRPDLLLRFDPDFAYMYRAYTLPEYRGKRLQGSGMARAMQASVGAGKKGLVSCAEATDFASLRSCYRLGYREFGHLACVRVAGRYVVRASKGCLARGFVAEPVLC